MEGLYFIFSSFLVTAGLFFSLILIKNEELQKLILGGGLGSAISLVISLLAWMLIHRRHLLTIIKAVFIRNLRLSCSYLYRIKVDDEYLLIKSRKHGKYQPVGGNFKRNKYSHDSLQKLILKEDCKFTNGGNSAHDLRFFIRGYKLSQFIRWYNSPDKKREVSYDREFFEELIRPNHLSNSTFKYPVVDFVKQIITPVRHSRFLDCFEVHFYDIVELNPDPDQLASLRALKAKSVDDLLWATDEIIRRQGYQQHQGSCTVNITDHSIEILS